MRFRKYLPLIQLIISLAYPSQACINIVGTGYDGNTKTDNGRFRLSDLKRSLASEPKVKGAEMEKEYRGRIDFEGRSDYAAALIYLGDFQKAISQLEKLEKEKSGKYYVAGNLGTAYELIGDNEKALFWISKEYELNHDAHDQSEWLHVKILEAKLAFKRNPDFLKTHTILDFQPGISPSEIQTSVEIIPSNWFGFSFQDQLKERMLFVKPPDVFVGATLYDYAAFYSASSTLENSIELLQLAKQYGYPSDKIDPLLADFHHKIIVRKIKGYTLYLLIGIAAVVLLYHLYRRKIFVLSRRDLPKS